MDSVLPAEIIDKPQDKCHYDRDDYAACYGNVDSPVFRAELQISR